MRYVEGLKCRECKREYSINPIHICEFCFGPLEVVYEYEKIKGNLSRGKIEVRSKSMWRYKELLPLDSDPTIGTDVGFTPLIRSKGLAKALGVKELYLKNDAVNYPTLSFKDRVVSVALSKAKEFGFRIVACASTGNLANSVAALAASGGLESYIFVPFDLEQGKILGTLIYGMNLIGIKGSYDEVNRLCSEIAENYGWAFVNINIRPFYAEGSKTFGFEIAEQMGWKVPQHVVVPMAGGSLITKIWKGFKELETIGLLDEVNTKIHGAQASGCNPIISAFKEGIDWIKPQRPQTIAKSLAIGNPADGYYALKTIRESGGGAEDVTDEEIIQGMKLLARTEGIFTETAGGVTVGVTKKLIEQGVIPRDESILISITGNGLKTQEAIQDEVGRPIIIEAKLSEFEKIGSPKQKERGQNSDHGIKFLKEVEMGVHVRIPSPLKKLAGGQDIIDATGRTVGEVLQWLTDTYPGLRERLRDEKGEVRRFINIYVNDEDIRFIQNLETPLKEGDQLSIIPAIAGGASLRKRVTLTFPPKLIKEPVIYNIGHRYRLVTNIRSANVSENVGWVTLEIDGEEEEYLKALNYLNEIGVTVEPIERDVIE
jgi:threonine synthase